MVNILGKDNKRGHPRKGTITLVQVDKECPTAGIATPSSALGGLRLAMTKKAQADGGLTNL